MQIRKSARVLTPACPTLVWLKAQSVTFSKLQFASSTQGPAAWRTAGAMRKFSVGLKSLKTFPKSPEPKATHPGLRGGHDCVCEKMYANGQAEKRGNEGTPEARGGGGGFVVGWSNHIAAVLTSGSQTST